MCGRSENSTMQLNQKNIEALIPHSGTMSLLNKVLKWDVDHIICLANSHRGKQNPLRSENILSSVCGVEYAAQAMAAHGALSMPNRTVEPLQGFLVSIKNLQLSVPRLDDIETDLTIDAKMLMRDKEFMIYQFRVYSEGRDLLSGRATISIKENSIN
jgi:predicted hotdog family 3-hydroxylacyl-ACP dehydratase